MRWHQFIKMRPLFCNSPQGYQNKKKVQSHLLSYICFNHLRIITQKPKVDLEDGFDGTLLEIIKLCPKIQFSEKFKVVNLNDFWEFLNARVALIIWIFAPKIVILRKYRINNKLKLSNLDNFWAENSNSHFFLWKLIFWT